MIAERHSGVQVQSNIVGQSYKAGIDDENMGWVIGLFTDLYSDPQRAVIREYSTNARDAQVEAGVNRPIEITLPSPLAPFFKVKDYGVGLDAATIGTIYSRYGSSTKRGSNDQNGMLGMGCKSALAYTQQFTVESVKDQQRTVVSVSREEGGVPEFTVVAVLPAPGEPNGTEVIVPVVRHHIDSFAIKAADFYSVWKPGTVLVNGEQPKRIEGLQISDSMTVVKTDGYSYNRKPTQIVMGGVAYPVTEDELDTGLPYTYYLVVEVPIGAVDFSPSRESLLYNKTTRATLAKIKPAMSAALSTAVQKEIDKVTTHREAIRTAIKWRDLFGSTVPLSGFKFKGAQMPERIAGNFILVNKSTRKLSNHEKAPNGFLGEYAAGALFVTGYAPTAFTAQHKRKLVQFAEDNGHDPTYFALTASAAIQSEWVEASQVVAWEDVKAVKLTSTSSSMGWRSGRPTGSYDAYIGGSFQHVQADEIDQDEDVYYFRGNRWESSRYAEIIGEHDPSATLVCLPENRYNKFMRNFPDAQEYRVGLQVAYDAWAESLTDEVREALMVRDHGETGWYNCLDARRVHDPRLARAITVYRTVDVKAAEDARRRFSNVLHALNTTTGGESWTCPTAQYPLLDAMRGYARGRVEGHLYLYMNAAYAALEVA